VEETYFVGCLVDAEGVHYTPVLVALVCVVGFEAPLRYLRYGLVLVRELTLKGPREFVQASLSARRMSHLSHPSIPAVNHSSPLSANQKSGRRRRI